MAANTSPQGHGHGFHHSSPDGTSYPTPVSTYSSISQPPPTWGYDNPGTPVNTRSPPSSYHPNGMARSIRPINRSESSSSLISSDFNPPDNSGWGHSYQQSSPELSQYRSWNSPQGYDASGAPYSPHAQHAGPSSDGRNRSWSSQSAGEAATNPRAASPASQYATSYQPATPAVSSHYPADAYSRSDPPRSQPSVSYDPRGVYTRTLVGPLCANACRLQDEHKRKGIFFLFQDLSVRTEGTALNMMSSTSVKS